MGVDPRQRDGRQQHDRQPQGADHGDHPRHAIEGDAQLIFVDTLHLARAGGLTAP
jgi:hypothetical protein